MEIKQFTPIVAIAGIVLLEYTALQNGINGTLFAVVVAAIAGLGGYEIHEHIDKFKNWKLLKFMKK